MTDEQWRTRSVYFGAIVLLIVMCFMLLIQKLQRLQTYMAALEEARNSLQRDLQLTRFQLE